MEDLDESHLVLSLKRYNFVSFEGAILNSGLIWFIQQQHNFSVS